MVEPPEATPPVAAILAPAIASGMAAPKVAKDNPKPMTARVPPTTPKLEPEILATL
eukprot:Awhi_evm1s9464